MSPNANVHGLPITPRLIAVIGDVVSVSWSAIREGWDDFFNTRGIALKGVRAENAELNLSRSTA
jgi:hypothetical protein